MLLKGFLLPRAQPPSYRQLRWKLNSRLVFTIGGMKKYHDWREWRRLRAVYLFQHGWTESKIAEALGASKGAVSQWLTHARKGGRQALLSRPHGTGLLARAMHLFATTTAEQALELGKMAAVTDAGP